MVSQSSLLYRYIYTGSFSLISILQELTVLANQRQILIGFFHQEVHIHTSEFLTEAMAEPGPWILGVLTEVFKELPCESS